MKSRKAIMMLTGACLLFFALPPERLQAQSNKNSTALSTLKMIGTPPFKKDITVPPAEYNAWVYLTDSTILKKVALYEVLDSSLLIANVGYPRNPKFWVGELSIGKVKEVKLRNKDRVWIGILVGCSVGALAGIAASVPAANKDVADCNKRNGWFCETTGLDEYLIGGTIGTVAGGIGGGLLGSIKIIIPFSGGKNERQKNMERLAFFAMRN